MNPHSTLDLGYADPEPPPLLLERVRGRGHRIRRRRRGAAIAGGAALALVVGLSAQAVRAHDEPHAIAPVPAGPVTRQASPTLPVSIGRGPSADRFTRNGWTVGGSRHGESFAPPAGPVAVLAPARGTTPEQVLYVSQNALVVIADRDGPHATPHPSSGQTIKDLPAEGLWGGILSSDYAGQSAGRSRVVIAGVIRGPVSKVVIGLPTGDVEAHLAPASEPELGTFYWYVVDDVDVHGPSSVAGPFADLSSVTRTVYRGSQAVFGCEGDDCLGPA